MSYAIQYDALDDEDWAGLVIVEDTTEFAAETARLVSAGYVVRSISWLPEDDDTSC